MVQAAVPSSHATGMSQVHPDAVFVGTKSLEFGRVKTVSSLSPREAN